MTQANLPPPPSLLTAARLSNLGNRVVSTASATYGRLGLGYLHARIVLLLGRQPDLSAARVAEQLEADPGAVSRAVNTLKLQGLLKNTPGPARALFLTSQGWEYHRRVAALSEERERRLLQGIPEAELAAFLATLDRLVENLGGLGQLAEDYALVLQGAGLSPTVLAEPDPSSEDPRGLEASLK